MCIKKDVIIACDFKDRQDTLAFLKIFEKKLLTPPGAPRREGPKKNKHTPERGAVKRG